MVSSTIVGEIGGLLTFLELILSAIVGVFLLQNFKFGLLDKINSVRNGEMSQDEFIKSSVGAAIGAVLLIIPGFFTDILGLLLQFSLFTVIFSKIFKFKSIKPMNNTKFKGDEDVIDVEVIDNHSTKH
jgi:2-isopropylmalate synthase/UPF0716 protein FxsA